MQPKEDFNKCYNSLIKTIDVLDKPIYNFYIPTKGRPKTQTTFKVLESLGIKSTLVVEPQDYQAYRDEGHYPLKMDKNDQGIYYARNFIKDFDKEHGWGFHWQLDDDIKRFISFLNPKRETVTTYHPFSLAEQLIKTFNIGGLGLVNSAFAFAKKTDVSWNNQVCGCFLLDSRNDLRFENGIIEDTDYSLQVLFSGQTTVLLNRFAFEVPPNGKATGGNNTAYTSGTLYKRQTALVEKYQNWFELEEKDGKARIKPSRIWRHFNVEPILRT